MKWYLKTAAVTILSATVITACKKVADLPFYVNGVGPSVTASATTIAAKAIDSNSTVLSFSWSDPKYANDSTTSKYIIEFDSAGRNFTKPVSKTVIGKLNMSFTARELNTIILNNGFALGTPVGLDARLISSYGNNNERYLSAPVKITVTAYRDSAVLKSSSASVVLDINTPDILSNTFTWSPAFIGYAGAVTYTLQYDSAGKNFAAPKEVAVGPSIFTKGLTQFQMNETALASNIPGGNTGKVDYRLKAVTAQGAIVYSNTVPVIIKSYFPLLRFYMPGSYQTATGNGTDWTPGDAPELIRDQRAGVNNNMYYIYIYLPANAEFKVTQGRAWTTDFGGTGGNLAPGGANFKVTTAGYYRVTINRSTLKYNIMPGRMGFIGGATPSNWTPGNVFPANALGNAGTNLFVGLTNFTGGGWKLIDNDAWDNGSKAVDETRSFGSTAGDGGSLETNGTDFTHTTADGRYRVIWDGRDRDNVKYFKSPATEMRIVGDAIFGASANWDPPTSPQMTYLGSGKWQVVRRMIPGNSFKFLAGNAWGAFDYEDATGGKIKWDGGPDFKVPAGFNGAINCTITLDENTQTWTITQ
ncbi:MAG: SusE domain-containing protein [Bacteroidota bacterium]